MHFIPHHDSNLLQIIFLGGYGGSPWMQGGGGYGGGWGGDQVRS